ncbi:MAG: VTT domain-containing protein [Candidatus Anstonellales archaeon]
MRKKEIFGMVLGAAVAVVAFYLSSQLTFLQEWGYAGGFFVALVSSATVILPAPGWAIVAGMASFLNPFILGVCAGIGSAFGELTGYMIGYGGREVVDSKKLPEYKRQKEWLRNADVIVLFVLAALPNPIFDVAGIAAGALKIPVWRFLLAVGAGKILKFIAVAYIGNFALAYI